jgi:hypothetical protein
MVRLKVVIQLATMGGLCLVSLGCNPKVTYSPQFIPVEFAIDLNGHLHVSIGQKVTTPIGTFGINVELSEADLEKAKDGTLVVIRHERDGRWVQDVYALHEERVSACLNGTFVMSADDDHKIVLQAGRDSVVRIVSSANAYQACSSPFISGSGTTPATGAAGLVVRLDEPVPEQPVPFQGSPVVGTVTGDLGDNQLWLFKYAPGARQHFLNGPLPVLNGQLDGETGQVGSDSSADVGQRFTVEVVLADSSASAYIQDKQPNAEGDVAFDVLPPGAKVLFTVAVVRE